MPENFRPNSYRYQRPFVMREEGGDHWIEDAAGVPLDRGQILEVLNGSLGPSWRSMLDLSPHEQSVLIYAPAWAGAEDPILIAWREDQEGWWTNHNELGCQRIPANDILAWMPLPSIPATGSEGSR